MADGLVVVDKPRGMTSHDVVSRLRKIYGQRSVGHAGTLDPDATGVLLVGLGKATRLLRFLQETTKGYSGTVVFGRTTDTLDSEGKTTAVFDMSSLTLEKVVAATKSFLGEIEQIPPMVSAIKIDGRRLHELARAGIEVERKPRAVRIDSYEVTAWRTAADATPQPEIDIDVECSSGTYIRTLAADLGTALGGGAHLRDLRRTRVGEFTLADSHSLDEIEAVSLDCVLSPIQAMRAMERIDVDGEIARKVGFGNTFAARDLLAQRRAGAGPFAVVHDSVLLAIYERRGDGLKPAVVLSS